MKKFFMVCIGSLLALCGRQQQTGGISATGTIEAVEITVSARSAGEVLRLAVAEGDRVAAGDTIAVIDGTMLEKRCAQADAGTEMARARLAMLLNGARSEDRAVAEQAVRQAAADLKSARTDAERMTSLLASGSIPRKQFDDVQVRLTMAESRFASAEEMQKKMDSISRPEEVRLARAQVRQAEAGAALLRQQLDECIITAPVAGTVVERTVEPGELAGAGTPVVTLARLETMELMIYVAEADLGKIVLNSAATVSIDSHPGQTFPGKVVYISPQAEFTPKNIQTKEDRVKTVFGIKITIDNPDGIFKPGMPADAVITVN